MQFIRSFSKIKKSPAFRTGDFPVVELNQPADASTLDACRPLGPSTTSNCTFCPSRRVLKPSFLIAEKWTNTSSPPSSGSMKPKPFASLNHFTVPFFAIQILPFVLLQLRRPCAENHLQRQPSKFFKKLRRSLCQSRLTCKLKLVIKTISRVFCEFSQKDR